MDTNYTLVGIVLGVLVLIVGGTVWLMGGSQDAYASMTSREIALMCTTDMATQFHIHPHLDIVINGVPQVIPANTGINNIGQPNECMHSIHTHDDTGTLHVEAPVVRDFTLGDFFAVWDKTFTKDQILDAKTDAAHQITVTVNGAPVDTYENTVVHDLDKIIITYGSK